MQAGTHVYCIITTRSSAKQEAGYGSQNSKHGNASAASSCERLQMLIIPAPGDGGRKAEPGAPVELVLTGWGAAKPGGPDGAWPPTPGPVIRAQTVYVNLMTIHAITVA